MSILYQMFYMKVISLRVFCQTFYTVFYSPDNAVYTNEVNTTESVANALIVSLLLSLLLVLVYVSFYLHEQE